MSVTYCEAQEVINFLRVRDKDGHRLIIDDSNEHITKTDIENLILDAEGYIDDQTHHAWRSTSVASEMYNFPYRRWGYHGYRYPLTAIVDKPIFLKHSKIRGPLLADTDKIEVWEGGAYVDYVANKTEGRASDWWCDYDLGILYFVSSYPARYLNAVKMTYRYGHETTVPRDIKKACIMLAATDILSTEGFSVLLPQGGTPEYTFRDKISLWEAQIEKIMKRHEKFIFSFEA